MVFYISLVLLLLVLVELALSSLVKSYWRVPFGVSAIVLIGSLSLSLLIVDFSLFSGLVVLISAFRVINLVRLIKANKKPKYLANIYKRSLLFLGAYLIVLDLLYLAYIELNLSLYWLLYLLMGISFVCLLAMALSLSRSLKKMKIRSSLEYISDQNLPTLTVAIPARNETEDLDACLASLVSSDYPKLEILVLDDCSQTKHTPEIIKSFAQSGVRFIEGQEPPSSYTAKNYAYEQLLDQASSKLILFCGVDVRFDKSTLRLMVEELIDRKKRMASFMPINMTGNLSPIERLAIQPWRYFFEIATPRRQFNRPAVLSTCWLIYASDLKELGGFRGVSRDVLPERYFAKQIVRKYQAYSFLRTKESPIAFKCQKSYQAQLSTAKRTYYPLMGSRLENVLVVSLLKLDVLCLPFVLLVYGLIVGNIALSLICLAMFLIGSVCFMVVANETYDKLDYFSLIFMPFLALFDIYQGVKSMWLYEFSQVIWKDRNVCIPTMRQLSA